MVLMTFAPWAPAADQAPSAADWLAIRGVIRKQLDAFRRDDAPAAFSHASPAIRATFGSALRFLAMVRSDYPPVHRPASVTFLDGAVIDGWPVQKVQVADRAGTIWIAFYPMERQADGSWRVDGCALLRAPGTNA